MWWLPLGMLVLGSLVAVGLSPAARMLLTCWQDRPGTGSRLWERWKQHPAPREQRWIFGLLLRFYPETLRKAHVILPQEFELRGLVTSLLVYRLYRRYIKTLWLRTPSDPGARQRICQATLAALQVWHYGRYAEQLLDLGAGMVPWLAPQERRGYCQGLMGAFLTDLQAGYLPSQVCRQVLNACAKDLDVPHLIDGLFAGPFWRARALWQALCEIPVPSLGQPLYERMRAYKHPITLLLATKFLDDAFLYLEALRRQDAKLAASFALGELRRWADYAYEDSVLEYLVNLAVVDPAAVAAIEGDLLHFALYYAAQLPSDLQPKFQRLLERVSPAEAQLVSSLRCAS